MFSLRMMCHDWTHLMAFYVASRLVFPSNKRRISMSRDFFPSQFVANVDAPRQHITSKSNLNNLPINSAIVFGQNRFYSRPQLYEISNSDTNICSH